MRTTNLLLILLGLVVAPVAGQQVVVVPDVQVVVEPAGVTIENSVEMMPDSVRLERIADAIEGLTAEIREQACDQCGGTSTVVRIGQAGLLFMLGYIGYQLKRANDLSEDSGGGEPEESSSPDTS